MWAEGGGLGAGGTDGRMDLTYRGGGGGHTVDDWGTAGPCGSMRRGFAVGRRARDAFCEGGRGAVGRRGCADGAMGPAIDWPRSC